MRGVDNDCECKHEYQPARRKDGLNPHVRSAGLKYALVATVAGWLALVAYLYYPQLSPDDPLVMTRWISERFIRVVFCVSLAEGYLLYRDWITNGNMIGRINVDAKSSAIFAGSIFLGLVLLLIGS